MVQPSRKRTPGKGAHKTADHSACAKLRGTLARTSSKIAKAVRSAFHFLCASFRKMIPWSLRRWHDKHVLIPLRASHSGEVERIFAQVHGDDLAKNLAGYEGHDSRVTCHNMRQKLLAYLKKHPEQRKKIAPLIKNLSFCLDLLIEQTAIKDAKGLSETEKIKKMHALGEKVARQVQALKPGESLLLPIVWSYAGTNEAGAIDAGAHFQAVFIRKQKDLSTQKLLIETSGAGHMLFASKQWEDKEKFPRFLQKTASQERIDQDTDFYKALFELRLSPQKSIAHAAILLKMNIWDSSVGTPSLPNREDRTAWTTGQRSGSCAIRPFTQLLFAHLPHKEAKEIKRQLLEMDIVKQHKKMLKNPRKRVLLDYAVHHLNQINDKYHIPEEQRGIVRLIQKKLEKSYKGDLCRSSKTLSALRTAFPKHEKDPTKNWGIAWKKGKKNKFTCNIDGEAYTLSNTQKIRFLHGFSLFFVVQTPSGQKKVILPKGDLGRDHPIAPYVRFKKQPKKIWLFDLNAAGEIEASTPEQQLYLATICLSMKRYDKAFAYLKQGLAGEVDQEKIFPSIAQFLRLTHAENASEASLATYAATHCLPQMMQTKQGFERLETFFMQLQQKSNNIREELPSYQSLKEQLQAKRELLTEVDKDLINSIIGKLDRTHICQSKYSRPTSLFGLAFNQNKEVEIEGTTYRPAKEQWLSFLPGFDDFAVLETDEGNPFVLLPNPDNPGKPYYLCHLDTQREIWQNTPEENIHLATIGYEMGALEKATDFLTCCTTDEEVGESAYQKTAKLLATLKDNKIGNDLRFFLVDYNMKKLKKEILLSHLDDLRPHLDTVERYRNTHPVSTAPTPHWSMKKTEDSVSKKLKTWTDKLSEKETPEPSKIASEWTRSLKQYQGPIPPTEKEIAGIRLIQPGKSFTISFLHYYHILTDPKYTRKDRVKVARKLRMLTYDLSPLNKELRTILLQVWKTPSDYPPLSQIEYIDDLSSFLRE